MRCLSLLVIVSPLAGPSLDMRKLISRRGCVVPSRRPPEMLVANCQGGAASDAAVTAAFEAVSDPAGAGPQRGADTSIASA